MDCEPKIVIHDKPLPCLNEYINACRRNRFDAARLKKKTERELSISIRNSLQGYKFDCPVFITIVWHCKNKKRDKDNIAFAKKFIFDSLVKCKTIENDGWKNISGFIDKFEIADKDFVEFHIYECPTEPEFLV